MSRRIRAKAVCVFWRGDSILVAADHDAIKDQTFYGPPGGGVEFGERASDAVRREILEELGTELCDIGLRGVLENIFTYNGQPGHDIVFVFEARLVDATLYERDWIDGIEGEKRFVAEWISLARFGPGGPPLYPTGLLELLLASRPKEGRG